MNLNKHSMVVNYYILREEIVSLKYLDGSDRCTNDPVGYAQPEESGDHVRRRIHLHVQLVVLFEVGVI
jgi:hypothetical protein